MHNSLAVQIPLLHGQLVTALIFRVAGVSFYPVKGDTVPFQQRQQLFPQINV